MQELTLWDYWRMMGPLGKLLFLFIAAVCVSLAVRSFIAARRGGLEQVRGLASAFERSAISIALLTLFYSCLIGWMVCKHSYYGSDFENTLTRTLREAIFHFKVLSCAFLTSTLIYFVGWSFSPSSRSKTSSAGV
jgi:hypothetical protein